jgi:hypothetical protein
MVIWCAGESNSVDISREVFASDRNRGEFIQCRRRWCLLHDQDSAACHFSRYKKMDYRGMAGCSHGGRSRF